MANFVSVGSNFNAVSEPAPMTDEQISAGLTIQPGAKPGTSQIQFNESGEVVKAQHAGINTAQAHGPRSSVYASELSHLQTQSNGLQKDIEAHEKGSVEYNRIINDMLALNQKAENLVAKEATSDLATAAEASGEKSGTLTELEAELELQDELAANRSEDQKRRQLGLPPVRR